MTPTDQLAARIPKDPDDHGPIPVPSDAVRAVVCESYGHPEMDAMATIAAALAPLDVAAQHRVLRWCASLAGVSR